MFRAAVFFLICALAPLAHGGDYTALDRYVAAPDASFRYTLVGTVNSPGIVAYQIDLVSQTWLTTAEVDKPVWHHWVTIYKPDQLTTSTAVLFIDGGSNTDRKSTRLNSSHLGISYAVFCLKKKKKRKSK